MSESIHPIKGRGISQNPVGRFEKFTIEAVHEEYPEDLTTTQTAPRTRFYKDCSKKILNQNDSPDIGPSLTLNPYRGCEHGCFYCFARPTHEYLGLSAGLDFESKIFIKENAPCLLRKELLNKNYHPQTITLSGVTDPYQPIERNLQLTRKCLEVLAEFCNPVSLITKNHLITRDINILQEMSTWHGAGVSISLTTLDPELAKKMEPRTSRPAARLKAIEQLSAAGIPVNVMLAPIIPGLTDHEIPEILKAASQAGAKSAAYIIVRLSHGLAELTEEWLEEHYPLKKSRVLRRIRDLRGGELNDTRWGLRKTGEGPYSELIAQSFKLNKARYGLNQKLDKLSTDHFNRFSEDGQMSLF